MNIKIEISVRRVAKGKLKKARFYADFRVSQLPNIPILKKEPLQNSDMLPFR